MKLKTRRALAPVAVSPKSLVNPVAAVAMT
jgi:hypothetical protein